MKKKRTAISLETKINILDRLGNGEGSSSVGKSLNLNEATIRTIKKNEKAIRQAVTSGTKLSAKSSSYTRNIVMEKMEKVLLTWIEDYTQKRIPLDTNTIKQKALRAYDQIKKMEPSTSSKPTDDNKNKFSASNGWLQGFLERHAINNVKIKGEIASGNIAAAKEFPSQLAKLIEEGGYNSDQVFNADETGLFWKRMPSRTYIAKHEKTASGFKVAKDRITFLFCSNASGDRILKPLLINKSLRPRALKGVDIKSLPVHWMANKKAWVTSSVFSEWFHNCFVPEVKRYMDDKGMPFKILLLIDNAPGHPILEHSNVKIVFLPPNTTALIQPLDQGIIATFKTYYIKRSFQYILNKIDNDVNITVIDAWKKFSIMDCIKHAALAVLEIRPSTLNACWKAIWPECIKSENSAVTPNMVDEVCTEIITLAQAVGGEGFESFTADDINEIIVDRVLNEDELLEVALEDIDANDSTDDDEIPSSITTSSILDGLQMANKLADHFLTNDHINERAVKFQSDLQSCMARYKELYKELSKVGSQRTITEFAIKINKPVSETVSDRQLPINAVEDVDVLSSSTDESDIQPSQHKRMRLLSETDTE